MSKISVVPYGPQHPVLPEPVHLDLVLQDEKIVSAIPSIGFIHRGLEKLVEKRDYKEMVFVAERICGICSFGHGMGYCEAVENVMKVEVPDRAKYLRTIFQEMSRLHSHTLWLGLAADAFGYESLFMQTWRIREKILDMLEMATGGRVIFSIVDVGGLRKDVPDEMLAEFAKRLKDLREDYNRITAAFLEDDAVKSRLCGVGVLTIEQANDLGCCGPFLRASGVRRDSRMTDYEAYAKLDFEPVVSHDGDSYARCVVRIKEIYQSIDLIEQAIAQIPAGDVCTPVKGMPDGEYLARVEQPRGEALYYVKGNGTKNLERFRVRTPTFANIPGLVEVLKGQDFADVGTLILTIDPCISCTER
ncbi:MAG: nickel-dependent hydrogenase large subunit [Lachnospiraceae bacterium]|jgi:ech hydrogenase subunit E|nr:nickel-dependent hydrogenase large subunit [Lachnospiraceae bacterium]